jgi:hypothetical protein
MIWDMAIDKFIKIRFGTLGLALQYIEEINLISPRKPDDLVIFEIKN